MAITPEQERLINSLPPEARDEARRRLEQSSGGPDPDDPPVWHFGNPFAAIWDPNSDPTKIGYYARPLSTSVLDFYKLDRQNELKRFQELAYQAGLYGTSAERSDIPFGAYDDDTFKIWQQLNNQAARFGLAGKKNTVWDVLQDLVNNRPEGAGKSTKKRAPLITELPDPRELEELVRAIAPNVIGRDPDDAFTQDFISMYQRIQATFQEAKHALAETEEGGTITAPPDPQALAAFRLRTENPEAYEEKRAAARQQAYTALLRGAL